jgi:cell division protein FtsL
LTLNDLYALIIDLEARMEKNITALQQENSDLKQEINWVSSRAAVLPDADIDGIAEGVTTAPRNTLLDC